MTTPTIPPATPEAATKAIKAYRRSLEFADDFDEESAALVALTAAGIAKLQAAADALPSLVAEVQEMEMAA